MYNIFFDFPVPEKAFAIYAVLGMPLFLLMAFLFSVSSTMEDEDEDGYVPDHGFTTDEEGYSVLV